ncbi:MAG TPA: xanthine dehydrogenase family protein molybdopterin-binding subunit [Candidatus Binataceae bacterium]|nr:xanthine dehydrogenase family protein molybdopterin-binding subunit [Candidatus Binataceae bacterium]
MARRETLRLGFDGEVREVAVVIPDDEPTPWQWGERFSVLRRETPRLDGALKATGNARYSYDIRLPGMLYGAILRSPHPHATVRNADLSAARRMEGVRAALRVDEGEIRFAGQEVAAVAALRPEIAEEALGLIKVEYQPLPFVVDVESAMADGAPRVFSGRSNVSAPRISVRGEVERGFAQAAAIHEAVYTTPVQTHVSLETHGAVASWRGNKLTVWCSTQGIFTVRDDLAVLFDLPPENVRVITEYLGGGFGSKFGAGAEVVIAARLARAADAPVKLMLPRAAEHVATGNRPSSWQRVKLGARADGALVALELEEHGSGGIGAGAGSSGPYFAVYSCPDVRTSERDVYINAGPSSPMRAPGWPQGLFALELAIDELARKLKLDRLEFRRRNNRDPVRAAEFELGAARFGWNEKNRARRISAGALRRGIGVSAGAWHGLGRSGPEAIVVARRDGRFEMRIGAQDIGTGTRTVLAMVAAEELGVPLEWVAAQIGDSRFPFSVPSGGSSTSPSDSPAVRQAAAHLKHKLLRIAAPMLSAEPTDLEARDGAIRVRFQPERAISIRDVCRRIPGDSISATGERVPNYEGYRYDQAGCQFIEVEVDVETGVVRVLNVVAVHDAGLIIDPLTARSQVNGGVIMGVGLALFEDRRLDPQTGLMVNPTMDDYKLPGPLDTPEIDVSFVEVANGVTNTGVLGLGEAVHVSTTAAIGCAVADAIGVPVRDLPITPDRVLAALGKV